MLFGVSCCLKSNKLKSDKKEDEVPYGVKQERAIKYSTQKLLQNNFRLEKTIGGAQR